jgi:branched-chain amino acid transport system substrate-binding protein
MFDLHQLARAFVGLLLCCALPIDAALAQQAQWVQIGLLANLSGPQPSLDAASAVQRAHTECERDRTCSNLRLELHIVDSENRPNVAISRIRELIDRAGAEVILIGQHSDGVPLAVAPILRERDRLGIFMNAPLQVTGLGCEPDHTLFWMADGRANVVSAVSGLGALQQLRWHLVAPDEPGATNAMNRLSQLLTGLNERTTRGTSLDQLLATSSWQDSQTQAVVLVDPGDRAPLERMLGAAVRNPAWRRVPIVIFTPPSDALLSNLPEQGVLMPISFFPDLDDAARRWAGEWRQSQNRLPSAEAAGLYSAALHYLRARAASQSTDRREVLRKMHEIPVQDAVVRNARLLVDGRLAQDQYLIHFQRSSQQPASGTLARTVTGATAFGSAGTTGCPESKHFPPVGGGSNMLVQPPSPPSPAPSPPFMTGPDSYVGGDGVVRAVESPEGSYAPQIPSAPGTLDAPDARPASPPTCGTRDPRSPQGICNGLVPRDAPRAIARLANASSGATVGTLTFLSDTLAITAAHVLYRNGEPTLPMLALNALDIRLYSGQVVGKVEAVLLNLAIGAGPFDWQRDVAVLRVRATGAEPTSRAQLAAPISGLRFVRLAGYGVTDAPIPANRLTIALAALNFGEGTQTEASIRGAAVRNCGGDSGGPVFLTVERVDEPVNLVGILSSLDGGDPSRADGCRSAHRGNFIVIGSQSIRRPLCELLRRENVSPELCS